MKPILVGSRALEHFCKDFYSSETSDWDIWCEEEDKSLFLSSRKNLEISSFNLLNNKEVAEKFYESLNEEIIISGVSCLIATPPMLSLIKRSHLWRDYKFEKHMFMYNKWLKKHYNTSEFNDVMVKRAFLTNKMFPQRSPSLDKTNEDFFDDNVKKKFDHDWLHELVSFYERPLYESLKEDSKMNKAFCEKSKWELLSDKDKSLCVSEECHVIACERFMIPSDWKFYRKPSYWRALRKVCTTLTSGWFRDWAIDHYEEILYLYNDQIFDKVERKTT